MSEKLGNSRDEAFARCHLATLPGEDVDAALRGFEAQNECFDAESRRTALFLLWRATGDPIHLEAAKQLVDDAVAAVSGDVREAILTRLPLHRDIMAAWTRVHGDTEVDAEQDAEQDR